MVTYSYNTRAMCALSNTAITLPIIFQPYKIYRYLGHVPKVDLKRVFCLCFQSGTEESTRSLKVYVQGGAEESTRSSKTNRRRSPFGSTLNRYKQTEVPKTVSELASFKVLQSRGRGHHSVPLWTDETFRVHLMRVLRPK